jgi:HD-GYP domain-containing protein (c-di-GMP phosphodiesterase class II)
MKFLKVSPSSLSKNNKYPFHLFIIDSSSNERKVALYKNEILSDEVKNRWALAVESTQTLQIQNEDKNLFIENTNATLEEIEKLNEFLLKMTRLAVKRLNENMSITSEDFSIKDTLLNISNTDNYNPLIRRVKAEILCLPLYKNKITSLATGFVDSLFHKDLHVVKSASLAYILAKHFKIKTQQERLEIFIAAIVKDIGYCFIQTSLFSDFKTLTSSDINYKHSLFSLYFLSETEGDISKNIKRFIMEHHENLNGGGFPEKKVGQFVSDGAFIVQLADEIIMCCDGRKDGTKRNLHEAMNLFAKQLSRGGINTSYPTHILEALGLLLLSKEEEDAERIAALSLKDFDNQLKT